jgi:predicted metal-dependent enzyme (double-stranded beta helix superfamily)
MSTFSLPARPRAALANPEPRLLAARLAADEQLWRPHVRFRQPRHYTRLVARPGWEAWLLTWLPGQSTGLHDHGGSAGAFAVLQGTLHESVVVPDRYHDMPRVTTRARAYGAGALRSFGARHIHDVEARRARAISLHVYTPGLTVMTRYTLDDGVLMALAPERAGADW